jgi:hypothetical protein
MVDGVDLELAAKPLKEMVIADVAGETDGAAAGQRRIERPHVEGEDVDGSALGEAVEQCVRHLAAPSGHEDHGPACHVVASSNSAPVSRETLPDRTGRRVPLSGEARSNMPGADPPHEGS